MPAAVPSHLGGLQFQQAKQQECDSLCIHLNVQVHKILSTLISFCFLKLHTNCLPTHKIADCATDVIDYSLLTSLDEGPAVCPH